jgi:transcriptional regulator with XRE-family HTH domain
MQEKERKVIGQTCRSLGLTQQWMGKQIGVKRSKISRWLSGEGALTEDELFKLGQAITVVLGDRDRRPGFVDPATASADSGKSVRYWRDKWGIGQAELGKRAGLSQGAVSGWEQGKLYLVPAQVKKLFQALDALIAERRACIPRGPLMGNLRDVGQVRSLSDLVAPQGAQRTEARIQTMEALISEQKELIACLKEFVALHEDASQQKDIRIAELEKKVADLRGLYELETEVAVKSAQAEELREKLSAIPARDKA